MGDLEYSLIEAVSVYQVFVLEIADNVYRNIVVDIFLICSELQTNPIYISLREKESCPRNLLVNLFGDKYTKYTEISNYEATKR